MARVEGVAVRRRLSPQCRCLSLHLDHVSSPRSSNPACGFPALGSHSRSCARPREARPSARPAFPIAWRPTARQAHVFPDSASGFQPRYRRGRLVLLYSTLYQRGFSHSPVRARRTQTGPSAASRICRCGCLSGLPLCLKHKLIARQPSSHSFLQ